jgi:hypothetical protein
MLPRLWVPFGTTQPNPYNLWDAENGQYYGTNSYMPWSDYRLGNAWYVNESYSSNIGPGLRDGDDSWVNNAPCNNIPAAPQNVSNFNNIYSLDDVEAVLQSGDVWNHYYNNHNGVDYWSDLVLTFPTKHYHWLFQMFPWWNDGGIANRCVGDPAPKYDDDWAWLDWGVYLTRVVNFRAGVADYLAYMENGPIGAFRRIWNMEQDLPIPWEPLPSPRPPVFDPYIPHEVNIIAVGDDTLRTGYNTGIHEGDPVLTTTYGDGQFTIGPFWLRNGERAYGFTIGTPHPIYAYWNDSIPGQYLLPAIMEIIFTHAYPGHDVAIRSTCTPVKFNWVFELYGLYPYWP